MQYQQLHQHTVSEVQDRDNRIAELTDRSLHLQGECQSKDADLSSKEEQVKVLSVELAAIKEQRNQGNRDLQKLEKAHRSLQKQMHEEEDAHKLVLFDSATRRPAGKSIFFGQCKLNLSIFK